MDMYFGGLDQVFTQTEGPPDQAGKRITTPSGRQFICVQNHQGAALAKGNVLKLTGNNGVIRDADVDAAAAADTIRVTGTDDFTSAILQDIRGDTRNGHIYFLWINAGAAQGQGGPIIQRVTDSLVDVYWWNSDDGAIATALTTASDFVVSCPTRVVLTTDPDDKAVGVCNAAPADNGWFWMQLTGRTMVLLDTDDTAISDDNMLLIPSDTTDGYAEGETATSTTTELASAIGRAVGVDQDADGLVLIDLTCGNMNYTYGVGGGPGFPFAGRGNTLGFPAQFGQ
jgi:hypothetical protein